MYDTDRVLAALYETAAELAELMLLTALAAHGFVDSKATGERIDVPEYLSAKQAEWMEKAEAHLREAELQQELLYPNIPTESP